MKIINKTPYWFIRGRSFAAKHLTSSKYEHKFREFKDGYSSFCVGNFINPHRPNSQQYKNWAHGQDCAYLDYAQAQAA